MNRFIHFMNSLNLKQFKNHSYKQAGITKLCVLFRMSEMFSSTVVSYLSKVSFSQGVRVVMPKSVQSKRGHVIIKHVTIILSYCIKVKPIVAVLKPLKSNW